MAMPVRMDDLLVAAVVRGDVAKVRAHIAHGAVGAMAGAHGATPLHWAASGDHAACVAVLVDEAGAIVDARAEDGSTPLHWAAREDALEAAAELLSRGANVDAVDASGARPADEAGDEELVALLGGVTQVKEEAEGRIEESEGGVAVVLIRPGNDDESDDSEDDKAERGAGGVASSKAGLQLSGKPANYVRPAGGGVAARWAAMDGPYIAPLPYDPTQGGVTAVVAEVHLAGESGEGGDGLRGHARVAETRAPPPPRRERERDSGGEGSGLAGPTRDSSVRATAEGGSHQGGRVVTLVRDPVTQKLVAQTGPGH